MIELYKMITKKIIEYGYLRPDDIELGLNDEEMKYYIIAIYEKLDDPFINMIVEQNWDYFE